MTNYIILLPPSEGKKKHGDETKPYRVVKNLKQYNSFGFLEMWYLYSTSGLYKDDVFTRTQWPTTNSRCILNKFYYPKVNER